MALLVMIMMMVMVAVVMMRIAVKPYKYCAMDENGRNSILIKPKKEENNDG